MILRFFLAFFICYSIYAQSFEERIGCLRNQFNTATQNYQKHGLSFVPGAKKPYWVPGLNHKSVVEDVTLTLSSGDDLQGIASVLAQGSGLDESKILAKLEQAASTTGRIDLKEVSPKIVQDLSNKLNPHCNEANCWNATLNWHDSSEGIRQTSDKDLYRALENSYSELKEGDQLKFGDVVVFEEKGDLEHTSIYLDENLMWHKAGRNNLAPYTFETVEGVLYRYFREETGNIRFFRKKPSLTWD